MAVRQHHPASITSHIDRRARGKSLVRPALIVVTGFSALTAIGGGVGVLVNGLGIPEEELTDTPFDSFLVPGLLLAIVVGGSMAAAAVSLLRRVPRAGRAAMAAGAVMLGWIVVEAVMIQDGRPLQVAVFLFALATLALGWLHDRQSRGAAPI